MRTNAFKRLLKGLASLTVLALIVSLPLALIGYAGLTEHDRRIEVLNTGQSVTAIVTEAFKFRKRRCAFRYQFQFNGQMHEGGDGGCPLVSGHPVGSAVTVRFNPDDPGNSVVIGANLWPGWSIVPLLLAPALILVGSVLLYAMIRDALGLDARRAKRRRTKKQS